VGCDTVTFTEPLPVTCSMTFDPVNDSSPQLCTSSVSRSTRIPTACHRQPLPAHTNTGNTTNNSFFIYLFIHSLIIQFIFFIFLLFISVYLFICLFSFVYLVLFNFWLFYLFINFCLPVHVHCSRIYLFMLVTIN